MFCLSRTKEIFPSPPESRSQSKFASLEPPTASLFASCVCVPPRSLFVLAIYRDLWPQNHLSAAILAFLWLPPLHTHSQSFTQSVSTLTSPIGSLLDSQQNIQASIDT